MLYFSLVHSRIVYGIENWGGADKVTINPLIITQKHFVRIIKFKSKRQSAYPLFTDLKILPVIHVFVYKVLKIFYNRSGNFETDRLLRRTRSVTEGIFKRPKVKKKYF